MAKEIITLQDLEVFKADLLKEIKALMDGRLQQNKKWLKSYQVRELLGISAGTLQTMRINGTLPFSKIGGLIFYDADLVNEVMSKGKR
ncbi:helix-turn-helix domain-containing protein [Chitinophaga arvensicola]|uniref:Helix-turn-helix domain-containing protein n=1 Tax=Chitinophaga arvensicola TaxID=29529 RepID=A0A1I0SE94_9BACT|nr:helix-turn-helix domain-containing protein [Chitinophaga arvensicola]SEW57460.1 hypothetical protein SAMN04488122_6794 [Chitinophaga arvensicola]